MRFKTISVLMISMTLILVSCQHDGSPTQNTSDSETQSLSKKPPKPPMEGTWITFTGELQGHQEVFGCCPNAGPFPEYEMTLSVEELPAGTFDGNIFMNYYGAGRNKSYIVQFWWTEPSTKKTWIEVRGGVIEEDRKNKITTVTFTAALRRT
jgi:hypothetical protein